VIFGTLSNLDYPFGVALQGTFGAVTNITDLGEGEGELLLFSTTNLPGGTPVIFGTLSNLDYPFGVALQGTFGAVTNITDLGEGEGEGELLLFSTTNLPSGTPVIFGTLSNLDYPFGVALQGTFGAVANILGEIGEGEGESEVLLFSTVNFDPGPTPTPSILPTTFPGNAGVTAKLLNSIYQNCPASTQAIITDLSLLSYQEQYQDLLQLTPQYKVIQFSLEKLDLLLHKELEDALYKAEDKWSGFVLGGYDNLSQKAVSPEKGYNGYTVQSYYQLLGFTYGGKSADFLGAIGASESYMNLNPATGFASYPTAWASIGFSSQSSRWQAGLKGLGGYSFIKAQRSIDYLNLVASTNHNAWNTSVEGKLSYSYQLDKAKVTYYDTPSYLYGQENTYTESGATGANFNVKNEKLSVIRNAFGLVFNSENKRKGQAEIEFFVDSSWVFEYYFTNNSYQAAFQGTDVYGNYHQTIPTRNFGRVHGGFKGCHNNFDWALVYTGLFGSHFMENSASLKLEKQF
jgi:hypothetical protein